MTVAQGDNRNWQCGVWWADLSSAVKDISYGGEAYSRIQEQIVIAVTVTTAISGYFWCTMLAQCKTESRQR